MKTPGHIRIADEAGIWRLGQTLKEFGVPDNALDSALATLKLGNWITDLNQLKDPGGSLTTNPAQVKNALLKIGNKITYELIDVVSDAINGLPIEDTKKQEYIESIAKLLYKMNSTYNETVRSLTGVIIENIDKFVRSLIRFSAYTEFVYPLPGTKKNRMDFDLSLDIFDKRYRQYFPHEHLDRPACRFTLSEYCDENENKQFWWAEPDLLYANTVNKQLGIYRYLEGSLKARDVDGTG